MDKLKEFTGWLWKPTRFYLGFGLLLAELLLAGALGIRLFAGYLGEVSICLEAARELFSCALQVLLASGLVSMMMQLVYWKDLRE